MRNSQFEFRLFARFVVAATLLAITMAGRLAAQHKEQPQPVLVNLLNPCGVAIQPQTGHVFVSTRLGVYSYDPSYRRPNQHRAFVEIDGYPQKTDVLGNGSKAEIAPLGLAFLDDDHLVVGGGALKTGEDVVRIYRVPKRRPALDEWIKETASLENIGPIKAGKESSTGEGNFYGVAVGKNAIWVTCQGDAGKGWIAKGPIKSGLPSELKPAIATKAATGVGSPAAITFTPDGNELAVGEMGTGGPAADSVVSFYDPATGSLKRKFATGLHDISGLAYSPKTKKLYATDFAVAKPEEGGLFELVIDGEKAEAKRIVPLASPTALAFDPAGHLYLTVFGPPKPLPGNSGTDPGELLYIQPEL